MLSNTLQKIGLSEKESKIYLATLELGTAVASVIAKKAKTNRLTAYAILQSLTQKGYVSHYKKKGIQHFSATHPQVLVNETEQSFQELKDSLPELNAIYSLHENRPKISFYEGREGLETLWNLSLNTQEQKVYQIAHLKTMISAVGEDFLNEYVKKRAEKGIVNYCIYDHFGIINFKTNYIFQTSKELLREVRIAPLDFQSSGISILYDNKVSFLSSKAESFGFLIESTEYSLMMKSLFKNLWEISKSDQ
ncbi:MAG: helix-turn-helix domain-containing protein [Candidatus Peregrinibacteria bacterium]